LRRGLENDGNVPLLVALSRRYLLQVPRTICQKKKPKEKESAAKISDVVSGRCGFNVGGGKGRGREPERGSICPGLKTNGEVVAQGTLE
jgi:hypothetical protein